MAEKIKVLHCVGGMHKGGGIESFLMNVFRNIDREKFDFTFLYSKKCICEYDDEILSLGGHIIYMPQLEKQSVIKIIKSFKKRENYLKTIIGYDVIQIHGSNAFAIYYRAKNLLKNNKIVMTHSHSSTSKNKLIHYLFRSKLSHQKIVKLACSEFAAKWMYGKEYKDSITIKNAIITKMFAYNEAWRDEIRESLNLKDEFVIGNVGRLTKLKNHSFILKVFFEVLKIKPNSKLLLVGRGELEEKIKQNINDMGIGEKVIFTGVRNDVNKLLSAMDVFLLPSFYEGLPVSAIEAKASGLKCFLSDKITPELSVFDDIKYISLQKSSTYWAKSILDVGEYNRDNKQKEIDENGYDIKTMVKSLEQLYIEQINKVTYD